ncbi:hypothetical protein [Stenotrophomonas indicatrix]|uniref:hypothetical protein n=1 Tax=Stenotrophomonas indicatrix TaxID=2045451 RepID=UPI0020042A36|nr:hypothetical protein [Stenotrophomonas indicatrix]MCK6232294.1 hypothetical protein [Stenotrophomonas indicatrix]
MEEASMRFDSTLYDPRYPDECPDTFAACLNARGLYESQRFALRLSPVVHRLVESILAKSEAGRADYTGDELQAYSTFVHETVHWWQHKGSTSGFIRSILYPVQTHSNLNGLRSVLRNFGAKKCVKDLAVSGELGLLSPDKTKACLTANHVVNGFMDTEFYLALTFDPKKDVEIYENGYFQAAGHSFLLTYAQVIGAVGELVDPSWEFLTKPQVMANHLKALGEQKIKGYYYGTPITRAPVGLYEIYEGQARFIQLQFLARSESGLTIDDARRAGMLKGVYGAAFDVFLKMSGTDEPLAIIDPVVALFLFICDAAINPTTGFPSAVESYEFFYLDADPGIRFAKMCFAVMEDPSLRGLVKEYSATEYRKLADRLSDLSEMKNHLSELEIFKNHVDGNDQAMKLVSEHAAFKFDPDGVPLRLLTGEFLSFLKDRLDSPEFFCWAGYWLNRDDGGSPRRLWLAHQSLFSDRADSDALFPRMHPDREESQVHETFNNFYIGMILYSLTKQWVLNSGEFDRDFFWLTDQSGDAGFQDRVSDIFRGQFGVSLDEFEILDHEAIWKQVEQFSGSLP